jgi:hypothetical protein
MHSNLRKGIEKLALTSTLVGALGVANSESVYAQKSDNLGDPLAMMFSFLSGRPEVVARTLIGIDEKERREREAQEQRERDRQLTDRYIQDSLKQNQQSRFALNIEQSPQATNAPKEEISLFSYVSSKDASGVETKVPLTFNPKNYIKLREGSEILFKISFKNLKRDYWVRLRTDYGDFNNLNKFDPLGHGIENQVGPSTGNVGAIVRVEPYLFKNYTLNYVRFAWAIRDNTRSPKATIEDESLLLSVCNNIKFEKED